MNRKEIIAIGTLLVSCAVNVACSIEPEPNPRVQYHTAENILGEYDARVRIVEHNTWPFPEFDTAELTLGPLVESYMPAADQMGYISIHGVENTRLFAYPYINADYSYESQGTDAAVLRCDGFATPLYSIPEDCDLKEATLSCLDGTSDSALREHRIYSFDMALYVDGLQNVFAMCEDDAIRDIALRNGGIYTSFDPLNDLFAETISQPQHQFPLRTLEEMGVSR